MIAEQSNVAVAARLRAAGCVFAEDEAAMLVAQASSAAQLAAMVARREAGEPLEHVLGWVDFAGLRLAVGPGVFVPRRRTEFLAGQAAAHASALAGAGGGPDVVVVDLCCGCGAVGAVVASVARAQVHAVDNDPAAVAFARRNLAGSKVYLGNLFEPLPHSLRGRVAVLVANVPYVPTGELTLLPDQSRRYEPRAALDGGADGLDVLRRMAAQAGRWLASGALLLVETSQGQAAAAAELLDGRGLTPAVITSDAHDATVVTARL